MARGEGESRSRSPPPRSSSRWGQGPQGSEALNNGAAVAVVGAGLAGLALARALQTQSTPGVGPPRIAVTVFEGKAVLESPLRTLTLWDGAGAIRRLGLWGEWLAIRDEYRLVDEAPGVYGEPQAGVYCLGVYCPGGRSWRSSDEAPSDGAAASCQVELQEGTLPQAAGELQAEDAGTAMRDALLAMLARSLLPGTLQMGCVLAGFREGPDGRLSCELEDGTIAGPFDLVVGADGLLSKVRTLANERRHRHLRARLLLLGDSQRCFGREWDAGLPRIRAGGNKALEDAVALAEQLLEVFSRRSEGGPLTVCPEHAAYTHSAELALSWAAWVRHSARELGGCRRRALKSHDELFGPSQGEEGSSAL
ncbi:unnamed protein product [Polarella glacialis]|uniref:FAD-binding domain-containing protein n=1 Tax=Polarella glacialis TaxID=89957 RepID=A0A813FAQ7_POLGL|nr:unnamed protein product [Polarella glacialis]CAE8619922.1 unnamed protein product [Polarella glacialis]CAE8678509.1 unnamed protein product [Polarella glacialis]